MRPTPNVVERLHEAAKRGDGMRLLAADVAELSDYVRRLENADPIEWRARAVRSEALLAQHEVNPQGVVCRRDA